MAFVTEGCFKYVTHKCTKGLTLCAQKKISCTFERQGIFFELICVIGFEFFFVELFGIDGAPGVDDVGEYEGHQQRDVEHRGQRELTRTGVLERQR